MERRPLTADELGDALELCASPGTEALLLLALPVDEAPLPSACAPPGRWRWRGDEEPRGTDPVASLVALVARNTVRADRFVDPDGRPWDWVRPVRSGASTVLAGFDVLLGGPRVVVDADAPANAVAQLPLAYVTGEVDAPPAVVETADGNLLVGGDASCWRVSWDGTREPVRPAVPPASARVAALARWLEAAGCGPVDVLDGANGHHVLTAAVTGTGWRADLPVGCTGAGTTAGVDPAQVHQAGAPDDAGLLPAGWSWAGTCDGDLVGATPQGTLVYLRPGR